MIPLNGNKRTSVAFALLRGRSLEKKIREQKSINDNPKFPAGAKHLKEDMAIASDRWNMAVYGPVNNIGETVMLGPDEMKKIALGIATVQEEEAER